MITILADDENTHIGSDLYEGLLARGADVEYISLENVEVKPCINCGGCKVKTKGKCVIRDDCDRIYPKLIKSDALIIVSPVTFGSYSFKTKRLLDKIGLIMDGHYFVKNKEIVKGGMTGRQFSLFAIGVSEDGDAQDAEAFKRTVHETVTIIRAAGKAFVVDTVPSSETRDDIIKGVLAV